MSPIHSSPLVSFTTSLVFCSDGMNRQVTLGRPWTPDEDDRLINAVHQYGDNTDKWKVIALAIPGRTNKACRKRWLHSLCPTVKKCAWSSEEDQLLLSLYEEHPNKWSQIARGIPGRTDDACSKRYREALDPKLKKGDWTTEEDSHLLGALSRQDDPSHPKWGAIGHELQRSGLACRNRWRLLERKKAMDGRKALIEPQPFDEGIGSLPQNQSFTNDWTGFNGVAPAIWNPQWDFNALSTSDFSNFDQAIENLVRQTGITESSGSSSVRTIPDDQSVSFEPLNDTWISSTHQANTVHPSHLPTTFGEHGQPFSRDALHVDSTIDPSLSDYASVAPEHSRVDLVQGFDRIQNESDSHPHFQPAEQVHTTFHTPEVDAQPESETQLDVRVQAASPPQPNPDAGLNRLGALAEAASALSPTPCPANNVVSSDVTVIPTRKRRRTTADHAMSANINVIDIGPQKPSPKLSSSLPVAGDPRILAYACGHTTCWPIDAQTSTTRFATSGELLSHFKDFHMSKPGTTDETPFKCGLQGCLKGWKSINGLQYHLQIGKTHYQAVMSSVSSEASSNTGTGTTSPQAGTDNPSLSKSDKAHRCPHAGCRKEYKQLSGLRYHLLHGHPKSVPIQLEILPPTMVRKLGLEPQSQVLQA